MAGLRMICKLCGGLTISDGNKTVKWVWDYERDEPVKEEDFKKRKVDKKALAKREREKWNTLKKEMETDLFSGHATAEHLKP